MNKVPESSEILNKAKISELLAINSSLNETLNQILLYNFNRETIKEFWTWLNNLDLDDAKNIRTEDVGIYSIMLFRICAFIKKNYPQKTQTIIENLWKKYEHTSEEVYEILSEDNLLDVFFIREFAKILKSEYSKNIYNLRWEISNTLDFSYREIFIKKILNNHIHHLKIADFMEFLRFLWKFDSKDHWVKKIIINNKYTSEDVKINDDHNNIIEVFYEQIKNGDIKERDLLYSNKYIYDFIVDFFARYECMLFDMFVDKINEKEKIKNDNLIVKNIQNFIKNKHSGLYKFIDTNRDFGFINTRLDDYNELSNAKNLVLWELTFIIWSVAECINSFNKWDLMIIDENEKSVEKSYMLKIWVNEEWNLGLRVYSIAYDLNTNSFNSINIENYIYKVEEKYIAEILSTFGKNKNPYQAVWMKAEDIKYNL